MRTRSLTLLLLGLAVGWLSAYPLVYDSDYRTTTGHTVCRFSMNHLPAGAEIRLYPNERESAPLASLTVKNPVSAPARDSLVFPTAGFDPGHADLRVFIDGLEFGEMVYVPEGRYSVRFSGNRVERYHLFAFYIGKRAVTNSQYAQFIGDDGYDTEEYWLIDRMIMKDRKIGWAYQGKLRLVAPMDWNLNGHPWYVGATHPDPRGAVTGITWFEANAFCNWIGASMPTLQQRAVCLPGVRQAGSALPGNSSVSGLESGTAEWTSSGADPETMPDIQGSEMIMLRCQGQGGDAIYTDSYDDPVFRDAHLGFRLVVPAE